nr:MAG TPA: major tail protein [Caudoviricetes sp.]
MKTKQRKVDVENIQIDHGIVFRNYGLETQKLLAPIRGGSTFKVERTIRQIEFDGQGGKTKGTEVIDDENATISAKTLNASLDSLSMALPGASITKDKNGEISKIESSDLGLISDENYNDNITMFCKTLKGDYLKISIFDAMADNGLEFAAVQKAEGEIQLDFAAHHSYEDETKKIYSIERIQSITYEESLTTV